MKIWVVVFRGEKEYATTSYIDAMHRANQLSCISDEECEIVCEVVE